MTISASGGVQWFSAIIVVSAQLLHLLLSEAAREGGEASSSPTSSAWWDLMGKEESSLFTVSVQSAAPYEPFVLHTMRHSFCTLCAVRFAHYVAPILHATHACRHFS
jgi:hypothetical protein